MRKFVPEGFVAVPPEAERKFQGEIYDVYQWQQELFDGTTATFEMLRRPDVVEAVAVKGDKVIITRQKQPRTGWYYCYPGGRMDATDADELSGAKRELREETGMEFTDWKLVNARQPFTKIDWLIYTFVATDFVRQGALELDGGEQVEVVEMSWEEYVACAQSPKAEYMRFPGFEKLTSLEDLLAMPALCEYKH